MANFLEFGDGCWGFFEGDPQSEQDAAFVEQEQAIDVCVDTLCGFCKAHDTLRLTDTEVEEVEARTGSRVLFTCHAHYETYVTKYTFQQGKCCCDPFQIHKKRVTVRLAVNTLEMFKSNADFIPGKKTCTNCRIRLSKELGEQRGAECAGEGGDGEDGEEEEERDGAGGWGGGEDHPDSLDCLDGGSQSSTGAHSHHTWSQDCGYDNLNSTLHLYGESPLKKKTSADAPYINEKISRLNQKMRASLSLSSPEKDGDSGGFIAALKERYSLAGDTQERYRCLTSCPLDWSAYKLAQMFGCGIKMARNAVRLRNEFGAGSYPNKRVGRKISHETKQLVVDFYMDQSMSRHLPGTISIGI